MHIERIHTMLEMLTECTLSELESGVANASACEVGQAIDMIKDLADAEYHATITKAMNEAGDGEVLEKLGKYGSEERHYYVAPETRERTGAFYRERDIDRETKNKMYYSEPHSENKLEMARRHYSESKNTHSSNTADDKQEKLNKLDEYLTELKEDTRQLIEGMSPEERTMTKQKMQGIVGLL